MSRENGVRTMSSETTSCAQSGVKNECKRTQLVEIRIIDRILDTLLTLDQSLLDVVPRGRVESARVRDVDGRVEISNI